MIRAKFDMTRVENNGRVRIGFDDIDEPAYPMSGDVYELYDPNGNLTVQAIVLLVYWKQRTIVLEPNWGSVHR